MGTGSFYSGGKTVKIEITYSLNEHIWVLQQFLLCPDVFFLRQKKQNKTKTLKKITITHEYNPMEFFFFLSNGAASIVYIIYNEKIASLNLLSWNFIWHKYQIYSHNGLLLLRFLILWNTELGQFRATAVALDNRKKLPEQSVVPAEFCRRTKEQEGRQLTKIPKRSVLSLFQISP